MAVEKGRIRFVKLMQFTKYEKKKNDHANCSCPAPILWGAGLLTWPSEKGPGGGSGSLRGELGGVRSKQDAFLRAEAARLSTRTQRLPTCSQASGSSFHNAPPPHWPSTAPHLRSAPEGLCPAPCVAPGRRGYPRCMVGPSPRTTWPHGRREVVLIQRGGGGGCGGMRQASALSAPLASPDYYERLGRLQHGLRDRYGLSERGREIGLRRRSAGALLPIPSHLPARGSAGLRSVHDAPRPPKLPVGPEGHKVYRLYWRSPAGRYGRVTEFARKRVLLLVILSQVL